MKTLLAPISNSFFIRNFLRTDALSALVQNGIRLVFLVPKEKISYYRQEFNYPNVNFDILPAEVKLSRIESFFKNLESASIYSRTTLMKNQWYLKRQGSKEPIFIRLFFFTAWQACRWLGQFRLWRTLVRQTYFLLPSNVFDQILDRYSPDLVFCPALLYGEYLLMKEAKKRKIRTLGMILSWDNLYSKTLLRIHPDSLITQTDFLKEKAQQFGDYPGDKIIVIGVPQYDRNFKKQGIKSREEFFKTLGGDPSRKLILYALSGKAGLHIEFDIINILNKAIKGKLINEPVEVLIRPYPRYDFPDDKLNEIKKQYGFLGQRSLVHIGKQGDSWEFDEESIGFLMNSLFHADIVIVMYSTFFIEAAIFDKPLIGITFDGYQKLNYWNSARRFFDMDHLAEIKKLNGIWLADSQEELIEAINKYLKNPHYLADGRKKIVEQQCQVTSGLSGRMLADYILKLLKF